MYYFFFSSRRRHTRSKRDWSSDVCSSDLGASDCVGLPCASAWRTSSSVSRRRGQSGDFFSGWPALRLSSRAPRFTLVGLAGRARGWFAGPRAVHRRSYSERLTHPGVVSRRKNHCDSPDATHRGYVHRITRCGCRLGQTGNEGGPGRAPFSPSRVDAGLVWLDYDFGGVANGPAEPAAFVSELPARPSAPTDGRYEQLLVSEPGLRRPQFGDDAIAVQI